MRDYPEYIRETKAPIKRPPPLGCDSQVHVYGNPNVYPPRRGTAYEPPDATFADVRRMHGVLGIERGVIVQASCYGTDHRLLMQALAAGEGRYRGCALVDDTVTDWELDALHAAGVRGARFNFASALKLTITPGAFKRAVARIAERGWFAKIFVMGNDLADNQMLFEDLELPVLIDHMGGLEFARSVHQPGMALVKRFLGKGNWWVMLSSGDRHSNAGYPWADAIPFAQELIGTAPERVVWATDWPHVIYDRVMPNDGDLLDLLYRYAPDLALQNQILVQNPAKLFQFQ